MIRSEASVEIGVIGMRKYDYTAAGGVVVQGGKVLVLNRPSRDEVRLPKGHLDPGESYKEAAVREVEEESGYGNLKVIADLGTQDVAYCYKGKKIRRKERYFLMALRAGDRTRNGAGEAQFEPQWLSFPKALKCMTFKAERKWIKRARAAYEAGKG